jgi:hypothetical protein
MAIAKKADEVADGARHTPYPFYSLGKALEVAEVVRDLGGSNGDVQKSLIAQTMKVEESSPSLLGILGAAKLYSLLEGRGTYRLSEVANSYFFPTSEHDRTLARLRMVKAPPLFSALIDKFDGNRLPPSEVLVNILHREHRIAQSWRTRAASLFLSSVRDAQLIDSAGFLRYRATLHAATNGSMAGMRDVPAVVDRPPQEYPQEARPSAPSATDVRPDLVADDVDVWQFKIGDDSVRLETSRELSISAWRKLHQYVQILKPEGTPEY